MDGFKVTGRACLKGQKVRLTLSPSEPVKKRSKPGEPHIYVHKVPDAEEVLAKVTRGDLQCHESRLPLSAHDIRVMINNIQLSFGLRHPSPPWSLSADNRLQDTLLKAKRAGRKQQAAIPDKESRPAIGNDNEHQEDLHAMPVIVPMNTNEPDVPAIGNDNKHQDNIHAMPVMMPMNMDMSEAQAELPTEEVHIDDIGPPPVVEGTGANANRSEPIEVAQDLAEVSQDLYLANMPPQPRMLDEAMTKYGSKDWVLTELPRPTYTNNVDGNLELQDLLTYSCRLATSQPFLKKIVQHDYSLLPPQLRPSDSMPRDAAVSYIMHNLEDGAMNVVRVFKFASKTSVKYAVGLCSGKAHFPAWRQGPWAWNKAVHSLLDRLPGHHVVWWSLNNKKDKPEVSRSSTQAWSVEDEELMAGVDYINKNAPEDDSENQQYVWILRNIHSHSRSPISNWPESKVLRMAQNKSRGTAGATSLSFFPMTVRSVKPWMSTFLLPLVMPLLTSYGMITLGWPGVGKTPFLILLCLAIGRYHITRLGLEGVRPAWRRAKAIDNFRHKTGQVHEGLILDDPSVEKLDAADMKSWLTSEEDQNCSGRYNDVKLVRNGMRALSSNNLKEEDEPLSERWQTSITWDEFYKLVQKFFCSYPDLDVLAILKRTVVLVFGKRALYLRLPSGEKDAPIHLIRIDLHGDLFSDRDKPYYAKYKQGIHELPPTFADDVEVEQEMLHRGMESLQAAGLPEVYISDVNSTIASKLSPSSRPVHLPSSPSTDEEARVPVPDPEALPVRCTKPPGRLGQFNLPSTKRRLTSKTSVAVPVEEFHAAGPEVKSMPSSSSRQKVLPDQEETQLLDPEEEAALILHG
ncbi:unnamed protein product [Symbiodinium natans]|uniref:Uncharacterized protein n=1 Tax=Symbiodinium natans TaxID=878477 RepID=A0A812QF86_9DINO|nr:unnamed protein product [Symbiodinium natans]